MKKLLVHMGPHKTGSTYIQKKLHENRESLKNSGIYYPDTYYLFFGHHYLLNALNGSESASQIRENFSLNEGFQSDIVLSSENFISLNKEGLKKLKSVFNGFDFKFVYYIRRPSVRLLSRWHEEVKQGGVISADNYFVNHLFRPMQSNEVNNFRHVDLVIDIFGRDAIRLIDYDTAVAENNMLGLLFFVLGKDAVIPDARENVNKMVDLSEIEIIRFLNFRASISGLLKGSNVREAFYYNYEKLSEVIDSLKDNIKKYSYEVRIGDTGFDKAINNFMVNNYPDLLVNKPSTIAEEVKTIPSCNWVMQPDLEKNASEVSRLILESMKGGEA